MHLRSRRGYHSPAHHQRKAHSGEMGLGHKVAQTERVRVKRRQGALRVGGVIKAKDGRLIAQERIDERETLKNNKKFIREEKQIQQENRRLREKKKLLNIQKEKEKKMRD
jgi:hypothetical protein